nr:MAG TPA: hypothetical protein [Caudoviricetes sp.]
MNKHQKLLRKTYVRLCKNITKNSGEPCTLEYSLFKYMYGKQYYSFDELKDFYNWCKEQ